MCCSYCIARGLSGPAMTSKVGRNAIDMFVFLAAGAKSLEITFTGGEALLEFTLLEELTGYACERAHEAEMAVNFVLKTNGTLLNQAIMHYMREHLSKVVISIDGTPTAHDQYRLDAGGKGTHAVVSRNLRALLLDGLPCVASVTVHPRFSAIVAENVRYLHELGVEHVDVGPAYGTVVWSESDSRSLARSLEDIAAYMRETNSVGKPLEVGPLYRESEHVDGKLSDYWGCHAGSSNLAFLPTGQITGCSALAMVTSRFPELVLGDVWSGLDEEAVTHLVETAQAPGENRPACRGCKTATNCTGGCLAINYSTNEAAITPPYFYCEAISAIPDAWQTAWLQQARPSVTPKTVLNDV